MKNLDVADENKKIVEESPKAKYAVTRAMVNFRAHELANLAGRASSNVQQVDYEQAKRDVTGETDLDRQNAALDGEIRL